MKLSRSAAVAGTVMTGVALPGMVNAQIDPNFYLESGASVTVSGVTDVTVANIDSDDDMEIIFATTSGGVIADFDGKDGYTTTTPNALAGATDEIMAGDIDGDGHIDIIYSVSGDGTYFYKAINNGAGTFTGSYIDGLNSSSDIDLVDWNADGDLDIVVSSFGSSFEVLDNDGAGGFTDLGATTLNQTGVRDIEFADLDNDGDMDLIHVTYLSTVPYTGSVYALENTTDGPGLPTFDISNPTILHQSDYDRFEGIVTLDFDGDGDLDLFFNRSSSPYGYARSNQFVEGTPFSFNSVGVSYIGSGGSIADVAVADFDHDGDEDLILASGSYNRLLLFDGTILNGNGGDLGSDLGDVSGSFASIHAADLNQDGNIDLVAASPGLTSAPIFTDESAPSIEGFTGTNIIDENSPIGHLIGTLTFSDIQDDPITVDFMGDDAAFFVWDEVTGELTTNAALDWETKGSDILFQVELSDGNKTRIEEGIVKINNLPEKGNGTFDEVPVQLFGTREMSVYEPGDYDMDGDTDLYASSYLASRYNSIFQQNGGSFIDEPVTSIPKYQNSAIFITSDSDLDLVVHDQTNDELRLFNNGEGGFVSYTTLLSGILSVEKMITGDFDGDALPDLAVQVENSSNNTIVYNFEDAGSGFVQNQYFLMNESSSGAGLLDAIGQLETIAITDFDGDGFDDMLAVTVNGDDVVFGGGNMLRVGEYGFAQTYSIEITQADGGESEVEVGDLDGDGAEDIAILRWEDDVNYSLMLDLHFNDGSGSFTLDQTIDLGGEYAADMKLVDIDGDNDLDLVTTLLRIEDVGGSQELTMHLETFVNDGSGTFGLFQSIPDVGGEDFQMMDVDGDDDLDIVLRYGFTGAEDVENQLKVYKNINVAPSAINLSATSFDEHLPLDTEVATLTVDDLNQGDVHILTLTTGDGANDLHNSFFDLNGMSLRVVKDVRFEDTSELNIYLSVYDGENTFNQAVVLNVNDVNLAPTGISLSATSFDEGTIPGSEIATISALDPNIGDTHVFDFAVGDGTNDADNSLFLIDDDRLIVLEESSFEAKPTYNIYLSASDIDNSIEQAIVLTVIDINQAATAIDLSNTMIDEGTVPGTTIATITVTDPNTEDSHELELVLGDGTNDEHNDFFLISDDQLILISDVDFDETTELNILIAANDGYQSFEQAFLLTVNDVLGLEDETANALGIYPNPGHDHIQINLDNTSRGAFTVKVSDLSGKLIQHYEQVKHADRWSHRIDMTEAEIGVYLVEFSFDDERFLQRWIKK